MSLPAGLHANIVVAIHRHCLGTHPLCKDLVIERSFMMLCRCSWEQQEQRDDADSLSSKGAEFPALGCTSNHRSSNPCW